MTVYTVQIGASKAGSIGSKYAEKRTYSIDIIDHPSSMIWDRLVQMALRRAYDEGLEHVLVERVEPRPFDAP